MPLLCRSIGHNGNLSCLYFWQLVWHFRKGGGIGLKFIFHCLSPRMSDCAENFILKWMFGKICCCCCSIANLVSASSERPMLWLIACQVLLLWAHQFQRKAEVGAINKSSPYRSPVFSPLCVTDFCFWTCSHWCHISLMSYLTSWMSVMRISRSFTWRI